MRGLRAGLRIGRIRVRREVRKARDQPWIPVSLLFAAAVGVQLVVGHVPIPGYGALATEPGAYELGRRLAAGEVAAPRRAARGFAGIMAVLVTLFTALKTNAAARDSVGRAAFEAELLAAPVDGVVVGELLGVTANTGWVFACVLLAGSVAFAAGTGSLLAGLTALLAGTAVIAVGATAGHLVGLAVSTLFRVSERARENKLVVGAPFAVCYALLFVNARGSGDVLGSLPLGWYGDLALVGAPGAPANASHALLAATGTAVVVPLFLGVTVPVATRCWLADPPGGAEEPDVADAPSATALDGALARLWGRPTRAVIRTNWRRVGRSPGSLFYVVFPLVLLGSLVGELLGIRPGAVPAVVALYVGLAAGLGTTLNPLGNEGVALPAALTAPDGGRHLVRGYVLSAALLGVPLATGATLAATLALALDPLPGAVHVLLAGAVALSGAALSTAIGVTMPAYEGLELTGSHGLAPPEVTAISAYTLSMVALGVPAVVGTFVDGGVLLGDAASLVVVTAAGASAYRYAMRTAGEYRVG